MSKRENTEKLNETLSWLKKRRNIVKALLDGETVEFFDDEGYHVCFASVESDELMKTLHHYRSVSVVQPANVANDLIWKALPDVRFIAMDFNKDWYGYKNSIHPEDFGWMLDDVKEHRIVPIPEEMFWLLPKFSENKWKKSLLVRPSNV
uniref:Uncharacterized protein n=1 Tax=Rhizobium phage LG08 TaxID=3129229 RepID=A0AAU8HYF1_9CAUD